MIVVALESPAKRDMTTSVSGAGRGICSCPCAARDASSALISTTVVRAHVSLRRPSTGNMRQMGMPPWVAPMASIFRCFDGCSAPLLRAATLGSLPPCVSWLGGLSLRPLRLKECNGQDWPCPHGCGQSLKRRHLRAHENKCCPMFVVICAHRCGESMQRRLLEAHNTV